jgi:glycosyltransferase involved in cell wall biosynthesis
MLDRTTPVILTYNEAPNIGRTLEQLRWARDIVVLDSFSNDETLEIISKFPRARVYQRRFDDFASQWTFALNETAIQTEWVLALDADFVLTEEIVSEIQDLQPPESRSGYRVPLIYCVKGRRLRHSLLPKLTVLYRHRAATFSADAHTYQINLEGDVGALDAAILHDDRKPFARWFASQKHYMELEAAKLFTLTGNELNLADRVRKLRIIAPWVVFIYCLAKGGILDGTAGFYYAWQRFVAECLLSLNLIEYDLKLKKINPRPTSVPGLIAVKPKAADIN